MERQLPSFVFKNKSLLSISRNAGCYHCCKIFKADEVKEFTDEGETALCPICKVDAIIFDCIGYELTESNLQKSYKYWFAK